MFNLNKYKTIVLLNTSNLIDTKLKKNNKNLNKKVFINYLFKKRIKIIRTFIFLHSTFFMISPFSTYSYKTSIEFKIKANPIYFLVFDNDYNEFFI